MHANHAPFAYTLKNMHNTETEVHTNSYLNAHFFLANNTHARETCLCIFLSVINKLIIITVDLNIANTHIFKGTFANESGAVSCQKCPLNTYSSGAAAVCMPCAANQYALNGTCTNSYIKI